MAHNSGNKRKTIWLHVFLIHYLQEEELDLYQQTKSTDCLIRVMTASLPKPISLPDTSCATVGGIVNDDRAEGGRQRGEKLTEKLKSGN